MRKALIGGGLAFALALASCGGDDAASGGEGTDEAFLKEVCSAVNRFRNDATEQIAKNPGSLGNEESLSKIMAKPFARFVENFSEAAPPADLKSWHDDATRELERVLTDVNDGKAGAQIFRDSTLFLQPSADEQERLVAAMDGVSECEGSSVIFDIN